MSKPNFKLSKRMLSARFWANPDLSKLENARLTGKWELHKFRKSFATMHHEAGVSARTLQKWLGHSSLETTLAYLEAADIRSERTREQVNNSFAVLRADPATVTVQ